MEGFLMSNYCNGFLPPGDRQPWPDAPFELPAGELPARKPQPFGNRDRATAIIWRWLDQRLDNPIHTEHSPHRSRIWVLDVFYYEVDRDLRQLRGGIVEPEGHLEPAAEILLSNPLRLERTLRRMAPRIFRNWPKEEGVAVMFPNGGDRARESVMSSVWSRLSEDPRFKLLAHTMLLHELALDPAIFRLATTACHWFDELRARDYQAAWQNLGAFRKVEAENPHLLPLLPLYLEAESDRLGPEPVGELKRWFLAQGVSDAAWRYLAKSDLSGFAPLWKRVTKPNRLLATVKFLRLLEKAGFPEKVHHRVTSLWLDALLGTATTLSIGSDWHAIDPVILGLAYNASRDIAWGVDADQVRDTGGVFAWAMEERIALDKNQLRAGWDRLLERWREARPPGIPRPGEFDWTWEAPTPPIEFGHLRAEPLVSGTDLKQESRALRNCLDRPHYATACFEGRMRIYSIRRKKTGERVAAAAFERSGSGWRLKELAGPGNTPPKPSAAAMAVKVADALGRACDVG
jgi:hypothetical protein